MRLSEAIVFLSLAVGLHAGVWTLAPEAPGALASGGAGANEMTLAAASAAQQNMVTAWQRPPETSVTPPDRALPEPAPAMPQSLSPAPLPQLPALVPPPSKLAGLPRPAALPQVDTTPAPPLVDKVLPPTRPKARPARKSPAPQATAQPERRAKGDAQQAQRGTAGAATVQAEQAKRTDRLRAQWGAQIHAKVQRAMRYPAGTRRTGTTKVALKVTPSGALQGVDIIRSSGDPRLDRAALQAVQRAGRFAKAPAELTASTYAFSLALTFSR